MNCFRHPQRLAVAICQKFGLAYCEECCICPSPRGHCRYRTRCIGWRLCKGEEKKKSLKEKTEENAP